MSDRIKFLSDIFYWQYRVLFFNLLLNSNLMSFLDILSVGLFGNVKKN